MLDGEIVALSAKGEPAGFQQLQGRIHLLDAAAFRDAARPKARAPSATVEREASAERPTVAYIAFDLLREGRTDWRDRPLVERRAALERLFSKRKPTEIVRVSTIARGDGRALYDEAHAHGWEGLIAKHAQSLYKSGKRTPDWRKIKIVREQEFVIGGWTEPRHTRTYFGALLLGVYDRRSPRLRRPHRYGLQRARTRARDGPVEAARNHRVSVQRASQDKRTPPLGAPRARGADEVHGMDRRRKAQASGLSRIAG